MSSVVPIQVQDVEQLMFDGVELTGGAVFVLRAGGERPCTPLELGERVSVRGTGVVVWVAAGGPNKVRRHVILAETLEVER
jgi:hypothetical protein